MDYTMSELELLSSVAELGNLYALPVFAFTSSKSREKAYRGLLSKGVFTGSAFTEAGLSAVRLLDLYQHADKHIRIENLIFADIGSGYVVISQKDGLYGLHIINKDEAVVLLLGIVKHLDRVDDGAYRRVLMSREDFGPFMENHADLEWLFYAKVDHAANQACSGAVVVREGRLELYDTSQEYLVQHGRSDVQKGLEMIFA